MAADVWSATSYGELRRDALDAERWSLFHPADRPKTSYVQETLAKEDGVFRRLVDIQKELAETVGVGG